ncbi:uncharacterized protein [Dermacentor albipictus]|uniref:uncharacterized protein isoform X1 n=1 Tax=Dermacentor albipictus TaxID=60249 RepID=UPI0038FC8288
MVLTSRQRRTKHRGVHTAGIARLTMLVWCQASSPCQHAACKQKHRCRSSGPQILKTLASLHWSLDKLPEFSAFIQPLLNGMEITEEQHREQSNQLRHELIHFLEYYWLADPAIVHRITSRRSRRLCSVCTAHCWRQTSVVKVTLVLDIASPIDGGITVPQHVEPSATRLVPQ